MARRVFLQSLGCAKNWVDSEVLLGRLAAAGWEPVAEPERADLLLVNTCAFIQPAVEESVEAVLELAEGRRPGQRLAVLGCLVERYREELAESLPEVELFVGPGAYDRLPELLRGRGLHRGAPGFLPSAADPRLLAGPPGSAYLKLSDGCDRHCTYCLIPSIRGPQRSRPLDDLLAEARSLVRGGVRELVLVAQDSTAWGSDLPGRPELADLLRELSGLDGLAWIRVLYAHPLGLTPRLLEALSLPRVCPYLDLPLQHASERVLRRMGRGIGAEEQRRLLRELRAAVPGLSLRSTFLVGFPGETEADFEELLALIEEVPFDHLGVFRWWPEEGSAAARLDGRVPSEVGEERRRRLLERQAELARERSQRWLGAELDVLVEGPSDAPYLLAARTAFQAPEVDGTTYVASAPAELEPGGFARVRVEQADGVDLVARWLGPGSGALPRPPEPA